MAAIDVRTGTTLVEDSGRLPVVPAEFAENGTRLAVLRGHHEVNGHAKVTRDATVTVFELATGKVCHG